MMNCRECDRSYCFSRRAMYHKEFYEQEWIPIVVGECIVPDIIDGVRKIFEIEGINIDEYHPMYIYDFKVKEWISDIILEAYLNNISDDFCYMKLACLLSERYMEAFEDLIDKMRTEYHNLEEYFIYMLVFLYGKPNIEHNYLKEDLGFDDYHLLQYVEQQKQYWKKVQDRRVGRTKLVKILNKIGMSGALVEKKSKSSQTIINATCSGKRRKITKEERDSTTQSKMKKELLNIYGGCVVCGITKRNLLEYIHIKPDVDCSEEEKLMVANGLIMCLHHHKLFDDKEFCVNEYGEIIPSKSMEEQEVEQFQLNKNHKVVIYEDNKPFLRYREELFYKNENKIRYGDNKNT